MSFRLERDPVTNHLIVLEREAPGKFGSQFRASRVVAEFKPTKKLLAELATIIAKELEK